MKARTNQVREGAEVSEEEEDEARLDFTWIDTLGSWDGKVSCDELQAFMLERCAPCLRTRVVITTNTRTPLLPHAFTGTRSSRTRSLCSRAGGWGCTWSGRTRPSARGG